MKTDCQIGYEDRLIQLSLSSCCLKWFRAYSCVQLCVPSSTLHVIMHHPTRTIFLARITLLIGLFWLLALLKQDVI